MAEMLQMSKKPTFGQVHQITAATYVEEVNRAGEGVNVLLHLYQPSNILCNLLDHAFNELASEFSELKFVRSRSDLCIEKYPLDLVPTLFIYRNGEIITKVVGPLAFGQIEDLKSAKKYIKSLLAKQHIIKQDENDDYEHRKNIILDKFGKRY